jgi:predicted nucleotidyltransferase
MNKSEVDLTQKIKKKIVAFDPSAEIILFGSRARGDARSESDWDVLILTKRNKIDRLSEQDYRDALFDLELETGECISSFVFSKSDWEEKHVITPFYKSIKAEGILL